MGPQNLESQNDNNLQNNDQSNEPSTVSSSPASFGAATFEANPAPETESSQPTATSVTPVASGASSTLGSTTPTPQPQDPMFSSMPPAAPLPSKKSKKGLLVGLIAGGAAVLAITGGVLAYALVYNNPDNAVADAFTKAFTAKSSETTGSMSVKSSTSTTKVDYKVLSSEAGQSMADQTISVTNERGQETKIEAHAAMTKEAIFVKYDNINSLIDQMSGSDPQIKKQIQGMFGGLIDKIDGKWVVFKYTDLETLTNGSIKSSQVTCAMNEIEKLKTDTSLQNELKDVYNKNRFIKAKSNGSDSDGNRYLLSFDETISKNFNKAMVDTKLFKAIDNCFDGELKKSYDKSADNEEQDDKTSSEEAPTFEVWVDGWSHELKKTTLYQKQTSSELNAEFRYKFNTNPKVTIPEGQTTVEDLKAEIEKIIDQLRAYQSYVSPSPLNTTTIEDDDSYSY